MNILFLGDIVGDSGCEAVKKYLPKKIKELKIDLMTEDSWYDLLNR